MRVLIVLAVVLAVVGIAEHRYSAACLRAKRAALPRLLPTVQVTDLGGGALATRVTPKTAGKEMLLVVPAAEAFSPKQLRKLSLDASATVTQLVLPATGCAQQQQLFEAARQRLAPAVQLVAGIGPGAELAQQWLAAQSDPQATAISLEPAAPACAALPAGAGFAGQWHVLMPAGVAYPGAPQAQVTVSEQPAAGSRQAALEQYLRRQVLQLADSSLPGEMPVVELAGGSASDTLTLFYSGDGGWGALDKQVAETMADAGYPVVGVNALKYFWDYKTPEQAAADLSQLMAHYRQAWGIKHFVLAGFSFGADVMPAMYNRLPSEDQAQVSSILLMAFGRNANFEIRIEGLLGSDNGKLKTGPEMARLPAAKVLCVYGSSEAEKSGCTDRGAVGQALMITGSHHFDGDYPALGNKLLGFLARR
ncbi:AcvB/VirJ family lysyl-phosphatidylglycerol hydrolase [Pseudomonas sp. NPDC007930]|uniref:virulence factor family protein n=1 Tax=Pseudomonas sp. NPDC007930 TaxID=3364417 RepID=UPI0036ED8BB9